MTPILLVATCAALFWFVRTRLRGQRHWRWVRRAWLGLGLPVVAGVALMGRADLLTARPHEFDALAAMLPTLPGAGEILAACVGGMIVGVAARIVLRRRIPARLATLAPRDRGELPAVAAMAITAGMVEEAMFRVWLPWLIAAVSGSALFGFAAATFVFAALHGSQGVAGVLGAGAMGAMMAMLYLSTGTLWLVVVLHAALDLAALLMPRRVSFSAATPSGRST